MMSIAQSGIWVKKSRSGLFGAVLYYEKNAFANARRIGALAYLFPDQKFPVGVTSHALRAFLTAILHCRDATQVSLTLRDRLTFADERGGWQRDGRYRNLRGVVETQLQRSRDHGGGG